MVRFAVPLLLLALASGAFADEPRGLWAAAGKADITPELGSTPVWIAGFGNGRQARSVHDRLYARALVLSDGATTVGLVGLDLIGLFHPEVEKIRAEVSRRAAFDLLVVASTHTHHGPDTMGLWGALPLVSGVDKAYVRRVRDSVADLVVRLAGELQPVRIAFAQVAGPVEGFVRDGRDPRVIDDTLSALVVEGADGAGAVGSLVNWACHPETLASDNPHLSADYCGFLCAKMERELGGTAVFLSGALGGMMTPDAREHTFAEAERIGTGVAERALAALARAGRLREAPIRAARRRLLVPVDNPRYHLGMRTGALQRAVFDAAGAPIRSMPLRRPKAFVESDVCALAIGPSVWATVPGELFPELAVGGYDGSRAFGRPLVAADNPNPPDVQRAPGPPYLRDLMGAPYGFLIGLANDELGYIVPEYDFQVNDRSALLEPQPPGDHYEETNSTGKRAGETILRPLEELIRQVRGG